MQPDPHWNVNNMIFGDNPVTRNNRRVPNGHAIMQAGNLFVFTMNNPVMFVDPSGRVAITIKGGGAAALRAIVRSLTNVTPVALPVSNLQAPNAPTRPATTTTQTVPTPGPTPTPTPPIQAPPVPLPTSRPAPAPSPTGLPSGFADVLNRKGTHDSRGDEYRFVSTYGVKCPYTRRVIEIRPKEPLTLQGAINHIERLHHDDDNPQGVTAITRSDALELTNHFGGVKREELGSRGVQEFPHFHPNRRHWVHIWYPF